MTFQDAMHPPLPPPSADETAAWLARMAEALGDTPETVIAQQWLREPTTEALCVGDPSDLEAIILQSPSVPGEPAVFGTSVEAVASLIPHLQDWFALNVPLDLADELVAAVGDAAEVDSVRMLDDIYHTLPMPIDETLIGQARLLTGEDRDVIRSSAALLGDGIDRLLDTLTWGTAAGVVKNGLLVSVAYTFAQTDRHADVGVVTRDDWRGQGLATMSAALLCHTVQAQGRMPVWSTGGTNLPSLQVARKLGFQEVSRRVYLVPELDRDTP
ncbi:MAG TPA: GNAT family N-acetyltransferase [Thermomicrobiales bacterium]|nr:GNAT family N-acetyltransferase [Thermomicrobiales bacterium]